MRQWSVAAGLVLAASFSTANEPTLSEEFWLWFDSYADEQGNVFDPIAFVEMQISQEYEQVQPQSQSEDKRNEKRDTDRFTAGE